MAGIFGNSAEDLYRERELNRYLDSAPLSEQEEHEALMAAVAKKLKRQRSRMGQPCIASQLVFEAIGEMDVNGANALTDLMQHGAEQMEWDDTAIGRLIREQVIRYVGDGIDMDRATADLLEGRDESEAWERPR